MKKTIILLLILTLILFSAGCAGRGDRGAENQKTPEASEVKSNVTQAVNTLYDTESSTAAPNETASPVAMSNAMESPTDSQGDPDTEWKYIDPSLVVISGEEDEKIVDI